MNYHERRQHSLPKSAEKSNRSEFFSKIDSQNQIVTNCKISNLANFVIETPNLLIKSTHDFSDFNLDVEIASPGPTFETTILNFCKHHCIELLLPAETTASETTPKNLESC